MTCADTHNAISLPESAAGHTPCDWRAGQTIDLFGQEAPHANHSAAPATKKAKPMRDIYFPSGLTSSASAALQQSLESKLLARLPMGGLTMFIKGWKRKATPLGRQYCQLAVSARPINVTDCGLWVSPTAQDHSRGNKPPRPWDKGIPLSQQVAMWPTPAARDHKDSGDLSTSMVRKSGKSRMDCLPRQAFGAVNGLHAPMESRGSLNPAFPCWLMGYPTAWESCADTAMPLCRSVRKRSSKRS